MAILFLCILIVAAVFAWRSSRLGAMKLPLLSLLPLAIAAVPVAAQHPDRATAADEREIARCIHRSARGQQWLEKALWGIRDQERGWIGAEIVNKNGSYDLGPMQINDWWVPRLALLLRRPPVRVRQWLQQDACFGVEAARWLLLTDLARSVDVWTAIGRYHSPTRWRQRMYVASLAGHVARRFGQDRKSARREWSGETIRITGWPEKP